MIKKFLFCIPNAGGASTLFFNFNKFLNHDISIIPLELPGHGVLVNEPYCTNFNEAIESLCKLIIKRIGSINNFVFSLFGYSMGAILSYKVSLKIKYLLNIEPAHMFFAASHPPNMIEKVVNNNKSTDIEFENKIREWGGLPPEILNNKLAKEYFLSIIWHDLKLYNTYEFMQTEYKYSCDISIFCGNLDKHVLIDKLEKWKDFTKRACNIYQFNDGHFFINKYTKEICTVIDKIFKEFN